MPKTILVLSSTYPRWVGDNEPNFVHHLSKGLNKSYKVIALTPHFPGAKARESIDGIDVIRFKYAPEQLQTLTNNGGILENLKRNKLNLLLVPSFIICQILAINKVLREHSISLVHSHWIIPQSFSLITLGYFRKLPKILVTSHGGDLFALNGKVLTYVKSQILKACDYLTVVSQVMKDKVDEMKVESLPVEVAPMGTDLSNLFSKKLGVEREKFTLLFVGRLVEKKGLIYLIKAMPKLIKRYPEIQLKVIGDGPEKQRLISEVNHLGIEKAVHFMGSLPHKQLPQHYRKAGLFVAPFQVGKNGDQEGLGLVTIEALGCGCKVVISDLKACDDIEGFAENVYRFRQKDVEHLENTIVEAIESDYRNFEKKKLIEHFSWESSVRKYQKIVEQLTHSI
ncbi:glycosyltransferase [Thalassotalea montiporae]